MDAPRKVRRGHRAALMLLGTGVASFVFAGIVAAAPAGATKGGGGNGGGSSGAPPGNNATIKINNVPVDNVDNQPHITCPFRLSLYNFDSGSGVSNSATVTFVAQPPSGQNLVLPPSVGDSTFTFAGPNSFQDYSFDALALQAALFKQPQQGYHVKVTVKVTSTGVTHGKGKGNGNTTKVTTKHKVFWLTCDPGEVVTPTPTPTPTVSPTTAVLGEKHTRKPPTTHVLGLKVTRLPFTGISSRALAVYGLATVGFVFSGTGLLMFARRPKAQFLR